MTLNLCCFGANSGISQNARFCAVLLGWNYDMCYLLRLSISDLGLKKNHCDFDVSKRKSPKLSQRILWKQLQSSSVVSPPIHSWRAAAITIVSQTNSSQSDQQPVASTAAQFQVTIMRCRVYIGKPQWELGSSSSRPGTHLPSPTLCTSTSWPCHLQAENQPSSSPDIEMHNKLPLCAKPKQHALQPFGKCTGSPTSLSPTPSYCLFSAAAHASLTKVITIIWWHI